MSGTVRRRQDFSDIDNLDRATEAFLREQRRILEERKFVRAPRTAPRWIDGHWKHALAAVALVLVGGIAVFAGVKISSSGRDLRAEEPETTISEEVQSTSEQLTEAEKTEAAPVSEEKGADSESETPAVTTATKTTEQQAAEEQPAPRTSAESSTTRKTETTGSSSSSSETSRSSSELQREKPVTTTATQRGSSGVKVISSSQTTRTTAQTTRTTASTTRTTARTTASTTRTTQSVTTTKQTTVTTTQSTTKITEAPKAKLASHSAKITDMRRVSNGYQQRVAVTINNVSSVRFNESRTFTLQLGSTATAAACVSGGASMIKTSGTSLTFSYSGPINGGGNATITFLIMTDRPLLDASCIC